jgi:hypothetical protein
LANRETFFVGKSFKTVPLTEYSPVFRDRAVALSRSVAEYLGTDHVKEDSGSFDILGVLGDTPAARIVIYQADKGRIPGYDPRLADGVYVLIHIRRVGGPATGAAPPTYQEGFAYFRLAHDQDLEEMARFIATCAWNHRAT